MRSVPAAKGNNTLRGHVSLAQLSVPNNPAEQVSGFQFSKTEDYMIRPDSNLKIASTIISL